MLTIPSLKSVTHEPSFLHWETHIVMCAYDSLLRVVLPTLRSLSSLPSLNHPFITDLPLKKLENIKTFTGNPLEFHQFETPFDTESTNPLNFKVSEIHLRFKLSELAAKAIECFSTSTFHICDIKRSCFVIVFQDMNLHYINCFWNNEIWIFSCCQSWNIHDVGWYTLTPFQFS